MVTELEVRAVRKLCWIGYPTKTRRKLPRTTGELKEIGTTIAEAKLSKKLR